MFRTSLFASAALAFLAATPAMAQTAPSPADQKSDSLTQQGAQAVAEFLHGKRTAEEVFSPGFLAAVPKAQIQALAAKLVEQFGPFDAVASVEEKNPNQGIVTLRYAKATIAGPITIDNGGKVTGLLLNDVKPLGDSVAKVQADLEALPGEVSALSTSLDGKASPLLKIAANQPLAIGSTFKLYVLSALAHSIERGEHRWDEVINLSEKSLPSGQMQEWPVGAPVTLHTLASMMISISDNTATDQLIRVLGRNAIGDELRKSGHSTPDKTLPFLTTHELFALKGNPELGAQYAAADEAEQEAILKKLDMQIKTDPASIPLPQYTEPHAIDTLEWFASANDIAGIMRRIAALKDPTARQILAISPSMSASDRARFAYVGYKGGSEPGVLNLSWLMQTKSGEWRVLTISWNDQSSPVDQGKLEMLAVRLLKLSE
ncbi:serine hydrolase [Altererythrobacter sp. FM1]|uniref:serine hydrolase n=1 Tax=Tsuneonella flava TaxID=2055955 RepID=UPI000C80D44E|nr:serine hydrolase [Tsuneonella flava]ROT95477.1 serine hydrolase [Altererythrobacter sp. FM1]